MRSSKIFTVWAWVALLMVLNGAFRELALRYWVGPESAQVLSALLGMVIVLVMTRPFLLHLTPQTVRERARIGLSWLGLTVVFELVFGYFIDGKSLGELAGAYAFWNGSLWPLVLLCLVATPFLWAPTVQGRPRSV